MLDSQNHFAFVSGRFDLDRRTARIDYVTPADRPPDRREAASGPLDLIGLSDDGSTLFTQPVEPLRNSCAPNANFGTFQEFIPVDEHLARVQIAVEGHVMHEVARAGHAPPEAETFAFGAPDPSHPAKIPLAAGTAAPTEGVTYTVQARPNGEGRWFTLAVGRSEPKAEVDLNQFPGARAVDVRVLQTDGFSEREVFSETRRFER